MPTAAAQGTCDARVVGDACAVRARAGEERAHVSTRTIGAAVLELRKLVCNSLVALGELVEAFLGVLEEGFQGGDVTVAQGQLLRGHL